MFILLRIAYHHCLNCAFIKGRSSYFNSPFCLCFPLLRLSESVIIAYHQVGNFFSGISWRDQINLQ